VNRIVKPLTPDGMVGWDEFDQLVLWEVEGDRRIGRCIGDPRGHTCRICLQGWTLTAESLKDQHWRHDFDEWAHQSCLVRFSGLVEREMWYWALVEARVRFNGLREIPNEYWRNDPHYSKKPWYTAEAMDGPFTLKLGRRKRVYHNGVIPRPGQTLGATPAAAAEFAGEDVTKEFGADGWLLHAWTDDKARDYLRRLSKLLGLDRREPAPGGGR
jgi:hypothetical protein